MIRMETPGTETHIFITRFSRLTSRLKNRPHHQLLHLLPAGGSSCSVFFLSPTAESFGVSAQIGSGVVRGCPRYCAHEGSTKVPPGFHGRVGCWGYRLSFFFVAAALDSAEIQILLLWEGGNGPYESSVMKFPLGELSGVFPHSR